MLGTREQLLTPGLQSSGCGVRQEDPPSPTEGGEGLGWNSRADVGTPGSAQGQARQGWELLGQWEVSPGQEEGMR